MHAKDNTFNDFFIRPQKNSVEVFFFHVGVYWYRIVRLMDRTLHEVGFLRYATKWRSNLKIPTIL